MFSQELLTNGELNHFSLKERMVEIGKRWHKLSQSQKDKYKKQVEEQQLEYKAELEAWVKVHTECRITFCPHCDRSHFQFVAVKCRCQWSCFLFCFLSQSLSPQERAVYKEFSSTVSVSFQSFHY